MSQLDSVARVDRPAALAKHPQQIALPGQLAQNGLSGGKDTTFPGFLAALRFTRFFTRLFTIGFPPGFH